MTDADNQAALRAEVARQDKHIANLRARAALAGYELHVLGAGAFVVARWGLQRELPDAAAVDDFLRRVGAPQ